MKIAVLFALVLLLSCGAVRAEMGEAPKIDPVLGEQILSIPRKVQLFNIKLEATIFKPKGSGPYPLIVINHGKRSGNPRFQARARYVPVARAFVRRGFAVLVPMRQGFSKSGGMFNDAECNTTSNGEMQAADVIAAIDYARSLPYVDASRIVVFGVSHGGLTTIALGQAEVPGVLGLVNFAGVYRQEACAGWTGNVTRAFASYGKKARYPSLWIYADNDSYSSPEFSKAMFAGFNASAPDKSRLLSFGAFEEDGHFLFAHAKGVPLWLPEVSKFMASLGLDVSTKPGMTNVNLKYPVPAKTAFAELADVSAVPLIGQAGRASYQAWLDKPFPRAFAISPSGGNAWAVGWDYPGDAALDRCREKFQQVCKLYAVDEDVVWVD